MTLVSKSVSTVFDGRVPYPEFASIETTMKCNLRCPMCLPYIAGSTVAGSHMEIAAFEKIAGALFPYVDRFQLTVSGEPLMTKGLGRMLELAAEYGVRTEYFTNGTLLNDRMISLIMPTMGEMCISFDGATKETFEYMREGATFESVLRNVERLAAALHRIPTETRPPVGFAIAVMEKNVRELPALVELAHRLGLDFVAIAHVFPVVAETQRQSLTHFLDLAKEWIGKALDRGRELGIPVSVQPLDQVIVAMADAARASGTHDRAIAVKDGAVEGLEAKSVNQDRRRPSPKAPVVTETAREHVEARSALRRREEEIPSPPPSQRDALPTSIWHCDFLWNRIYVTAEGVVRPCCVPGVPDVADFRKSDLDAIWDNDAYRSMRIGLVRKEPVPVCRGCQHIREATDPAEIERLLQGRTLPAPFPPPAILYPLADAEHVAVSGTVEHPVVSATSPALTWPATPGALGYEFESSAMADGKRVRYDTAFLGVEIPDPTFTIPDWVWRQAPIGAPIEWRALAKLPDRRVIVARGVLLRTER